MSYANDRERFVSEFSRRFPNASYADCLAFLRIASEEQRWNEIQCSIQISERLKKRHELRSARRIVKAEAIANKIGASIHFNGDPRGYPFALFPIGTTFAEMETRSDGLGVPGRGLPLSAFN